MADSSKLKSTNVTCSFNLFVFEETEDKDVKEVNCPGSNWFKLPNFSAKYNANNCLPMCSLSIASFFQFYTQ